MCDCIDKVNAAIEPTGNRLLLMLFFDGSPSLPVIVTTPVGKKAKRMNLTSPFCPFCGIKYSKEINNDSKTND
jgi:hypothetical protein